MALGKDKAPRYLQTLTHAQSAWAEAQKGGRSKTVRRLVAAAMAGGLEPAEKQTRRVLVAALEILAERGSWLRGSPRELLQDLRVGESTSLEFADAVCERMQATTAAEPPDLTQDDYAVVDEEGQTVGWIRALWDVTDDVIQTARPNAPVWTESGKTVGSVTQCVDEAAELLFGLGVVVQH